MAVTENLHTGNGSKTNYAFTFPYLKTTDIKVSVDGTVVTNFTAGSPTATEIQFNTAPANNAAIRIYRDTATENLSATFYAGSSIKSEDLNDNFLQNLYVTQEAKRDADAAWQDGDETISSTETWASNNSRVATTGAIDGRIDAKVDTALTTDVSGGDGVTIVDNSPGSGQIRVDLDADIATLKDMQSGAATQLAALTSTELGILDGATVTTAELNLLDGVTATTAELNILDGVTATKDEINLLDGVTSTTAELNILDGVTATKDELNTLDGVTATTAELNILDGVTATKDEINILDGVTSTAAELNILDGVTATAAELNTLDGVTATAAELNKTDGLTASTAELNILDGVTATTAELNILDGVTATTDELNKTDGLLATPTELNTLDGITSNTSELNKLDGVTASTTELNIVAGKTFKTSSGTLDTTSDTEIPSSKVIAAHVASSQTAIGGFVTIADEVSFPNTQPANGVVVSINNAAGVVVNGSGVSTSAKRVDNTTVTINGFPSSLNGETLAAGVGLVVTSTSTANTYTYHKLLASETDVKQLSDDINDFNARYRVASSAPGSNNDAGDMYFDTSANKMKVYNGTTSAWDDVASVGSFYVNTLSSSSGTGGGSATFNNNAYRFTLSNAGTSAQQHIVSVNGVIQKPNAGTSQPSEGFAISGNDIIFAAAPASGADFFIITCGSSVSIGTPSANSVNSSHIIDGSIVDGDISSSAAISEGKLDIHNAPATGKYLKYTSNGMEWADGASEGTDVKSTGESGTAKFLRVDGDGTCSWQVPPNTQLTLNDEDDFASNSATAAASQQSIKAYVDAKPSSPSITATATGSIGNQAAVIVDGAGTVATPSALSIAAGSAQQFTSDAIEDNEKNTLAVEHIADDKIVVAYKKSSVDNIYMKVGTIGGAGKDTVTWGSEQEAVQSSDNAWWLTLLWDPKFSKLLFVYTHNDGYLHGKVCSISGTTITFGSETDIHADNSAEPKLAHIASREKNVVTWRDLGDNKIKARQIILNGSDLTMSVGSGVSMHSETITKNDDLTDISSKGGTSNHCFLVTYRRSNKIRTKIIEMGTSSGDFPNLYNEYALAVGNSSDDFPALVQHARFVKDGTTHDLVLGCYEDNDDSNKGKVKIGNITTGNSPFVDWQSVYTFDSDNIDISWNYSRLLFISPLQKFLILYRVDDDKIKTQMITAYSSNTADGGTAWVPTFSNKLTIQDDSADGIRGIWMSTDGTNKRVAICYRSTESNAGGNVKIQRLAAGTTLTAGNFIGFSDAAYTNGQTATINVVGSTTTQSSLTAGEQYYVQDNGTIATTAGTVSVEAGKALSATKLLIKG